MAHNYGNDFPLKPKRIVQIYAEEVMSITVDQAKEILELMIMLAENFGRKCRTVRNPNGLNFEPV